MDQYLRVLFEQPNDFNLVDALYVRISEKCDGSNHDDLVALPSAHRIVLLVWGGFGIVGNGGFQYLFESNIVNLGAIVGALEAIDVPRAAAAARRAFALFPDAHPPDSSDRRFELLEQLGDYAQVEISRADSEFWAEDRTLRRNLAAFVRSNACQFEELRPSRHEDFDELKQKNRPWPGRKASVLAAVRWLQSIDAWTMPDSDNPRRRFRLWFRGLWPKQIGSSGIELVCLCQHRNCIDTDVENLVSTRSLADVIEIDVSNSYISERGIASLARLENLRRIELSGTDFSESWLPHVASINTLEELGLSRTKVGDDAIQQLLTLAKLKSLTLSMTGVTDCSLELLATLPKLQRLCLIGNVISDEGVAQLSDARQLRDLDLRETSVTEDGMARLRAWLPDCEIVA